ncbi:MAG: CotH kinase family protein [Ignavibacteriales bacterium]|nr:CotH kinase family protein [Ignavibacteriales bacterium]
MSYKIFFIILLFVFNPKKDFSQVTFTSSNLPIVVINTHGQDIPDDPKITADMGIIDNGPGLRNNITDPFNVYNGKIGIEIRGHSSQMFPKKQYGIELRDNSDNDIKASLLGFPEESDFVLNASYTDKTFLRNVIAYKLSNDLGRYASRTHFCEVVLNGVYIGIYILQEKIKRDKNRVNIKKMSNTDITGDAVTGGYIVKIDRVDPGDKYWTSAYPSIYGSTKSPVTYIHEYPKADDIVPAQQNYIKDYINRFETIMYSGGYRDPFAGYYNLVDIDSFVDFYLINEFSKNTDAYRLSAFLYKNRDSEGGKLVMGPIWDYDISFGLADYDDGFNPAGWQAYKHYDGLWSSPFWTTNLMIDPVFKNKLAKRWNEVKYKTFSISSLTNFIEENVVLTVEARTRNFSKWKDLFNPAVYTWPNQNHFTNYEDEVAYLKSWISERTTWLNNNISANYSDVEWLATDLSKVNFEIGKMIKIPLSSFIKSKMNVTSINFQTLDINCRPEVKGDTLSITVLKAGSYLMKGVGMQAFDIVSISPDYKIEVTPTSVDDMNWEIPECFKLFQNYPNPFNPETVISYQLPVTTLVILKVYDLLGRDVVTLVNELQSAGLHNIQFSSRESNLPSGVYYYKLNTGKFSQSKKMILVK